MKVLRSWYISFITSSPQMVLQFRSTYRALCFMKRFHMKIISFLYFLCPSPAGAIGMNVSRDFPACGVLGGSCPTSCSLPPSIPGTSVLSGASKCSGKWMVNYCTDSDLSHTLLSRMTQSCSKVLMHKMPLCISAWSFKILIESFFFSLKFF